MVRRPIINSRDEPHADMARYRRLHVIVGDANMAELSTYLKVGTSRPSSWICSSRGRSAAVRAGRSGSGIKQVSRDLDMKETVKLTDGRATTAVAIQRAYLKAAMEFYACHDLYQVTKDILVRWEDVLDKSGARPRLLAHELDWVAKRQMIESYMERKGCGWDDPRVRLMDLQYHDIRPDKGLYYTLERSHLIERIVQECEIATSGVHPADGDARLFPWTLCQKVCEVVYGASWTSVLFDVGNTTIKKVPLMDPLRGTEALTRELLDPADTVDALIEKLKV